MSVKTMSDEAVKIDYCTVCLKRFPGPPIKCFSRVCNDCRKMIERGQVDEHLMGHFFSNPFNTPKKYRGL